MKQIFLQKGTVHVEEVCPPLINDHHVLVRVHYSFISAGTEVATITASNKSLAGKFASNISGNVTKLMGAIKEHGVAGTFSLIKEKTHKLQQLGYSCSGQIVSIGSKVETFRIGDFVACAGSSFANHAELVSVPQNLVVKVKNPSFLKQASLTTIGAIALQGIRRAQLQLGEKVCILGLGLIGQLATQLAKLAGCHVIGVDIQENRLSLAKKLGADRLLNPLTIDVIKEIEFATAHHGVDVTIIAAAADTGTIIQQAMLMTRRKGRVVLVGDVKLDFDREPFYSKEIDFVMSCSYGPGRYDSSYELESLDYPYAYVRWTENRNLAYFVELIENGSLAIDPLISQEFSIRDSTRAYASLQKNGALGTVLAYDPTSQNHIQKYAELFNGAVQLPDYEETKAKPYVHHNGKINTSMIGVGGFAKVKLLPLIAKIKNAVIHSIIDTDAANAITIARVYQAQRVSNDFRKIVGDDDIKVAVIATPHAFHAEQTIACLNAGKAVLVEKPAAITFEQFVALKHFFVNNKDSLFCVDFNRSCSLFMKAIKEIVVTRTNPLLINYRMNAGYLPKGHWQQTEQHRGRIVGEACHIFELFCFLTDAKPIAVSVSTLNPATDDLLVTDNFTTSITMSDGSCCSLLYTSLGNLESGKEYMELFVDGKTIIMNDYLELKGYGLPSAFSRKTTSQDKGHEALFQQFFKAARSKDFASPIPVERILMATELSLVIDKLARSGGGIEYIV